MSVFCRDRSRCPLVLSLQRFVVTFVHPTAGQLLVCFWCLTLCCQWCYPVLPPVLHWTVSFKSGHCLLLFNLRLLSVPDPPLCLVIRSSPASSVLRVPPWVYSFAKFVTRFFFFLCVRWCSVVVLELVYAFFSLSVVQFSVCFRLYCWVIEGQKFVVLRWCRPAVFQLASSLMLLFVPWLVNCSVQ